MKKFLKLIICTCSFMLTSQLASAEFSSEISDASTFNDVYITSSIDVTSLKLYRATYLKKRLVEIKAQDISLRAGDNSFSFDGNVVGADTVKFLLWDNYLGVYSDVLIKDSVQKYTVIFKDWDGSVLSTLSVKSGSTAQPPAAPTRSGYVFSGWEGSYQNIVADTVITAKYLAQTETNIFSVTNASGSVDDIITVAIALGGTVNTCGFDMRLVYDNEILEYVSHDADWQLDVIANHVAVDRLIKFNFGATKNRTTSAKIMEVSFRIKSVDVTSTSIRITPIEVIFADAANDNVPTPVEFNIVDGMVTVN